MRGSNVNCMRSVRLGVASRPTNCIYKYEPTDSLAEDMRFKNYGLAPKSAADFSFLLHGFHFLKHDGAMAIILPHGVLFRGGSEAKTRRKLLENGYIDTVIGIPEKLFIQLVSQSVFSF